MAITITSPTAQVVNRNDGVTISWTTEYPSSSYEILWRVKGSEAWNTSGKVTSTETSATLDLSNFSDITEYHYRVVVYSDNSSKDGNTTIYSGNDSSAAYSLILVPDTKAILKIKGFTDTMVEVPIYDNLSDYDSFINIGCGDGVGQIPLVDGNSAMRSNVKIGNGMQTLADNSPVCEDTNVDQSTYLAVRSKYSYLYSTNYNYASNYSYTSSYAYLYYYSLNNNTSKTYGYNDLATVNDYYSYQYRYKTYAKDSDYYYYFYRYRLNYIVTGMYGTGYNREKYYYYYVDDTDYAYRNVQYYYSAYYTAYNTMYYYYYSYTNNYKYNYKYNYAYRYNYAYNYNTGYNYNTTYILK